VSIRPARMGATGGGFEGQVMPEDFEEHEQVGSFAKRQETQENVQEDTFGKASS
jgi:hypothetical protein